MSAEWLLSTMRSWSPFATKTGWVMSDRSSGSALSGVPDGFELSDTGLHGDSFVAVVGALLEAVEIVRRGAFALGGTGKEQEVPGVAERQARFEVGDDGDLGDLVDAAAAARTRAGEDHSSHEFRCL